MINDKSRTKTSKDGDRTYTDSTYRTWLRNVGEGGDRSSLVRTVSTCVSKDDNWISADITLADCTSTINYDLYIDSEKSARRQLDFIGKLRDELLIAELEIYHACKAFGFIKPEGDTE